MKKYVYDARLFICSLFLFIATFCFNIFGVAQNTNSIVPGTAKSILQTKNGKLNPAGANNATARLQQFYSSTGRYTLSADGIGSTSSSMVVRVDKPNVQSTVQKAILISSVTSSTISNGCVTLAGSPITWNSSASVTLPLLTFTNYWADVTAIVAAQINGRPAGVSTLPVTECSSGIIEGEALLVVFNDPTATEKTVIVMVGAQDPNGDNFPVTLAQPIDPTQPGALLDMGLGIGYSYQGNGTQQFSNVSVNGQRLTSAAGGNDDGTANNGALITVGGIGDLNTNPTNPLTPPSTDRSDDELYNILPFITSTTTNLNINTVNPSLDDNIFLAYFALSGAAIIGEGILLSQTSTTGIVGTTHTVKAAVSNTNGQPVAGRLVTFSITSGPNAGTSFSVTTNASGEAFATYTGNGGPGTDVIQACFINSQSQTSCSNTISFTWTQSVQTLSTNPLANSSYCPGTQAVVSYTASGTYNAGNVFTAQLSNASGSFATPTAIGSTASVSSGNISVVIPATTPAGTGYRIRVVSSDPIIIGADNGSDITINELPAVTCPSNITISAATAQCGANVSFAATGTGTITYSPISGSFFSIGKTTVTATSTTACGTATCTFDVTVTDNQNPVINNLPANITKANDVNVCGATVSWMAPTVSDNCTGASIVQTAGPANSSVFPIGTTTVTYTATDAVGNTVSQSFTVTIKDTQAPVTTNLTASPNTLWPPNHQMEDVIINYASSDNCGATCSITSITSSEPINGTGDGDTAPDWEYVNANKVRLRAERAGKGSGRVYTITVTCLDASGNSTSKTVTVTVPKNQSSKNNRMADINEPLIVAVPEKASVISPNPTTGQFAVQLNAAYNVKTSIIISNSNGKVVMTKSVTSTGKGQMINFNLQPFAAGLYTIQIASENETETKKIMLIK